MKSALDPKCLPPPRITPLSRSGDLFVKWEDEQPSGSVKYRLVYARVVEALERGEIRADTTLVEASQGYVALALAWVGRELGLPVELHCGPDIDPARRAELLLLGATLIVHSTAESLPVLLGELADRARREPRWSVEQYRRDALLAGYRDLGREVVAQLRVLGSERPRAFVCPIGTGGLMQGVGVWLRRCFPDMRLIAVEAPIGCHFSGTVRNTEQLHMGARDPYDRGFPDETWYLDDGAAPESLDGHALVPSAAGIVSLVARRGLASALLITPE